MWCITAIESSEEKKMNEEHELQNLRAQLVSREETIYELTRYNTDLREIMEKINVFEEKLILSNDHLNFDTYRKQIREIIGEYSSIRTKGYR